MEAIDAFMGLDKIPSGVDVPPIWQLGRELGSDEYTIKIPLEVNAEIGDQKLIITAYPNHDSLKFAILISFEPAICRLDFDYSDIHPNTYKKSGDDLESVVKGPHYHSWEMNRRFFTASSKPIELHNAEKLPLNIHKFDAALRWFCDLNKIILPHTHRIELPSKTNLFS